ncbi:hypothetical protein SARC_00289 [Sphaeroforma arctica JP610]|uniref:Uncharacterized protein n=1 Tax=Sphaeroforma arctica JP610 TaxID=667725 RepID=A0A0L0GF34_9EUKA|nr:hypothetical protein SARC_00289 [Sphaeroforma arctica JP610]KNC87587.1 hypothetical protein SARC_00289 [Sphaeroforma arctica JP610]|eukprot:XP_014161489.1 hypothetical protein SARC_00289 [Sphaeroforma arctica JP610]
MHDDTIHADTLHADTVYAETVHAETVHAAATHCDEVESGEAMTSKHFTAKATPPSSSDGCMSGRIGSSLELTTSRDVGRNRNKGGNPYAPSCEYAAQVEPGCIKNNNTSIVGNPYAPACEYTPQINTESTRNSVMNSNRNSAVSTVKSPRRGDHNHILHEGHNRTNQTDIRRDRAEKADTLSQFSKQSFWLVLLYSFLITFAFTITNLVLLSGSEECNPHYALSITIVSVSGVLHLCTVSIYIWQVHKHRENIFIRSRGKQFLLQICILSPCVIVFSTLLSLTYLGALSGVCIYSNAAPWDGASDAVLFALYTVVRLVTTMFLSAIIARQRLLYLLFIHKATRAYSKKALSRQYLYTNLCILGAFLVAEVPYFVIVIKDGKGENGAPIGAALISQVGFVAILLCVFSFYAYKTRKIELTFSDWGANVRVLCMFTVTNIILAVLLSVKGANLALGLFSGAVEMFVATAYIMDSFSALLVSIYYGIERTVVPAAVQLPSLSTNLRSASRAMRANRRSDDTEVGRGKTLATIASAVSHEFSDEQMGGSTGVPQAPVDAQIHADMHMHLSNTATMPVVFERSTDETS